MIVVFVTHVKLRKVVKAFKESKIRTMTVTLITRKTFPVVAKTN